MRKPRDYDAELKALDERTKALRSRKLVQLGELVSATVADTLPVEVLAGALLAAVETTDAQLEEGWRRRGAAFFHGRTREAGEHPRGDTGGEPAGKGDAESPAHTPGAE
ncbi:conjugal transfer protein TraD [Sphingomonas bacterium]|uniref:conjugal transfer protein TraD n=1 Tax=Sphingomonas bacterium TaxID=1895847 RepID=UPI001575062B|nr:conjugal transfer protein TraD [Sphingomonas bacterium]